MRFEVKFSRESDVSTALAKPQIMLLHKFQLFSWILRHARHGFNQCYSEIKHTDFFK